MKAVFGVNRGLIPLLVAFLVLALAGCASATPPTPAAYIKGFWNCTTGHGDELRKFDYLVGHDSIALHYSHPSSTGDSYTDFFTYTVTGGTLTVHQTDGTTTWNIELPKSIAYGKQSHATGSYRQQDSISFQAEADSVRVTVPERNEGPMSCTRGTRHPVDQSTPDQAVQTMFRAVNDLDCDTAFAVASPTVLGGSTCAQFAGVMQNLPLRETITGTKQLSSDTAEVSFSVKAGPKGDGRGTGILRVVQRDGKWFVESKGSP